MCLWGRLSLSPWSEKVLEHSSSQYQNKNLFSCVDINECLEGHNCLSFQRCENFPGGYDCFVTNVFHCRHSYFRSGIWKECKGYPSVQHPHQFNTQGPVLFSPKIRQCCVLNWRFCRVELTSAWNWRVWGLKRSLKRSWCWTDVLNWRVLELTVKIWLWQINKLASLMISAKNQNLIVKETKITLLIDRLGLEKSSFSSTGLIFKIWHYVKFQMNYCMLSESL